MAHPGGAPRTVCPEKDDLIALGKEMVAWVYENEPLHLCSWWRAELGLSYNEWKAIIKKEEFRPYYNKAMGMISHRYMDGTINSSIAHRFLRNIFTEVREEEDETMVFQSKLKAQEAETVSESAKTQMDALLGQIRLAQVSSAK